MTLQAASAMIADSHRRSEHYGLRMHARPDIDPLAGSALSGQVERNRMLCSHALPAMETLYQQIANTHNMVLLTDADGVILHSLGDADFLAKANRVGLAPGVDWSEARRGTNAIGTAIAEQAPATVHASQPASQPALPDRQPLPHLFGGADSRPSRRGGRRTRRQRRPAQLPQAHDGRGAHVGIDDRKAHVRG
jgi:hypothetical protein